VLQVVFAVLAGYGITGDDAIDATRALRGFLTLGAGSAIPGPDWPGRRAFDSVWLAVC
jgi:hypothetical protein